MTKTIDETNITDELKRTMLLDQRKKDGHALQGLFLQGEVSGQSSFMIIDTDDKTFPILYKSENYGKSKLKELTRSFNTRRGILKWKQKPTAEKDAEAHQWFINVEKNKQPTSK